MGRKEGEEMIAIPLIYFKEYIKLLTPLEHTILVCFRMFTDPKTDLTHVSIDKIVEISGISRSSTNRAIRGLKEKGYITNISRTLDRVVTRLIKFIPNRIKTDD